MLTSTRMPGVVEELCHHTQHNTITGPKPLGHSRFVVVRLHLISYEARYILHLDSGVDIP